MNTETPQLSPRWIRFFEGIQEEHAAMQAKHAARLRARDEEAVDLPDESVQTGTTDTAGEFEEAA